MIKEKRICVFGDSGVSEEIDWGFAHWVSVFRKYICKQDENNSVFGLGISGETSKGLLKRIESEAKARNPNIILIVIGDNDSRIQNQKMETSEKEFKINIEKIIKIAKRYSTMIIFLGSHPCNEHKTTPTIWSKKEYFYNKNQKKYNDIVKLICKQEKIKFIDVFDEFYNSNYKQYLDNEDGLHLNKKGNLLIARKVIDFGKAKKMW